MASISTEAIINLNVRNQASLQRTLNTTQKLNSLIRQLKPINLLAPKSGAGADAIRKNMKIIQARAKAISSDVRQLSATFAGAAGQASAFSDVLKNVKIEKELKRGKSFLESQNTSVQELAISFVRAEAKAEELQERFEELVRSAKIAEGLAAGPATQLDSIEAKTKKRAFYEDQITEEKRKQNRLDREALRAQNKREKSAKKTASGGIRGLASNRFFQDIATGGGFPLLMGGGPGGVAGGLLGGAFAGLGGSIVGSAIGQQLDRLGAAALATADIFLKLTDNLEALTERLGRGGGDGFGGEAAFLASEGFSAQAAQALTARFDEVYGSGAVGKFEELAAVSRELKGVIAELGIELQLAMRGPLKFILDILKNARLQPDPGARRRRLEELEQTPEGLSLSEKAELGGIRAQDSAQNILNNALKKIEKDREKIARSALKLEKGRLTSRRDSLVTQTAALALDKIQLELNKTRANLDFERNRIIKNTLKIRRLEADQTRLENEYDMTLSREANDLLLARRAIQADIVRESLAQFSVVESINSIETRRFGILQSESKFYNFRINSLENQQLLEEKVLEIQRKAALVGVNEEEIKKKINETFKLKLRLSRESIELQRQEAALAESARRDAELARRQEISRIFANRSRQAEREIRGTDPARAFSFAGQGVGFFGASGLFEANRLADSAAQLSAYNEEIANLQQRISSLQNTQLAGGVIDIQRIENLRKELENVTAVRDAYQLLQPEVDRAAIFQARYNDALTAITPSVNALVGGLTQVVNGTKSVQEAFADLLNSMADQLLKTAQQMIAQYIALGIARSFGMGGGATAPAAIPQILGQLAGRANGGPVSGGTPYVVGERGPELFVPSRSGTVVPNNALGGNVNVVVNVTEGQTDTRGGSGQANQLGNAIAAAVQSELIKQKRPGGLLAS